ncbi:MAG: selenium metabolism-associated LysR family transcriptional regulator [Thermincola sp.]|jgi:DNA-binding transcriptional LysR family regulator|nr:selenium metabolism-associated LysR family transcriptional regulator [Thermincola sp.]MDT3703920.1 selenium metabolism-associated LysR family transcriptional regulator [Thermincola sp.]
MFSLRQLKAFVTVAENKSFTKAAKTLYMTQPAVSAQIKALEERLEICLLERNDKNIVLTEAGEIFYQEAQKIISLYLGFMEALDELKGVRKGKLCLAASTIPGEYVLPNLLGDFNKLCPGVELTLRIADTGQVAEQLLNRTADIGMIGAMIKNEALHLEEFKRDELIVIASISDKKMPDIITLGDLARTNLLLREADSGTRMFFLEELKKQGVDIRKLKVGMEFGSTRAIITAVQSGLGVSVVSRLACQDALELGKIRKIKLAGFRLERPLFLAWNKNKYQSHAVKAFLKYLRSQKY